MKQIQQDSKGEAWWCLAADFINLHISWPLLTASAHVRHSHSFHNSLCWKCPFRKSAVRPTNCCVQHKHRYFHLSFFSQPRHIPTYIKRNYRNNFYDSISELRFHACYKGWISACFSWKVKGNLSAAFSLEANGISSWWRRLTNLVYTIPLLLHRKILNLLISSEQGGKIILHGK